MNATLATQAATTTTANITPTTATPTAMDDSYSRTNRTANDSLSAFEECKQTVVGSGSEQQILTRNEDEEEGEEDEYDEHYDDPLLANTGRSAASQSMNPGSSLGGRQPTSRAEFG